jgi:alkylated DNA repair dioxygenase AlkB
MKSCNAYVIPDLVGNRNPELLDNLFENLDSEVQWLPDVAHKGGLLPRKFAVQCLVNDNGDQPLYRHPMDKLPLTVDFTPIVDKIRKIIENELNVSLNYAIIQCYRDGNDHITEHSDKTTDIVPGTLIVNYSVGTTRRMKFRSKEKINEKLSDYHIVNMDLTNDSLCVLDLETNRFYKHGIKPNQTITDSRISITFRTIGTFYDKKTRIVYGQGAPKEGMIPLSKEELLYAWSYENKYSDYENLYERGYEGLE